VHGTLTFDGKQSANNVMLLYQYQCISRSRQLLRSKNIIILRIARVALNAVGASLVNFRALVRTSSKEDSVAHLNVGTQKAFSVLSLSWCARHREADVLLCLSAVLLLRAKFQEHARSLNFFATLAESRSPPCC